MTTESKLRLTHLKIKLTSIGAECRIIRREERRAKRMRRWCIENPDKATIAEVDTARALFWSLRGHRDDLSHNQRFSHLAYGFLRGVPYAAMEQRVAANDLLALDLVRDEAERFCGNTVKVGTSIVRRFTPEQEAAWKVWRDAAEAHRKATKGTRAPAGSGPRVARRWTEAEIEAARRAPRASVTAGGPESRP